MHSHAQGVWRSAAGGPMWTPVEQHENRRPWIAALAKVAIVLSAAVIIIALLGSLGSQVQTVFTQVERGLQQQVVR